MKKVIIPLICFSVTLIFSENTVAQFHTIERIGNQNYIILPQKSILDNKVEIKTEETVDIEKTDSLRMQFREARQKPERGKTVKQWSANKSNSNIQTKKIDKTQGLTITSLYNEILANGIKHPKIVLAQAILETGWFKSSVCRNKGNLFGLTNPRTGKYYEFNDWRESVTAYRDKVQYKYKGGNYLLWLEEIGYAESGTYVKSLIEVLEKHIL